MINLFYLSPNTTGGWVTFTAHLYWTLYASKQEVRIYKIGNNTESFSRPFGYGLRYYNTTLDDALRLRGRTIITAAAKKFRDEAAALLHNGAKLVLHDPTELKAGLAGVLIKKPWVIRRAVQAQVPDSVFIRHPYVRRPRPPKPPKRKGAISISRIDFDKHTEIILDANRLGAGIRIHGFENRLYTKFKIMPNYPEWEQSVAHYPRDINAAFNLLLGAYCMVDMSLIKGDGGGTQYTFLEAWDADTTPIIHTGWIKPKDDMVPGKNCYTAIDGETLADVVRTRCFQASTCDYTIELARHSPKVIAPKIMDWLIK